MEKLRRRNALDVDREGVLVTGGATAGLGAAVASVAGWRVRDQRGVDEVDV